MKRGIVLAAVIIAIIIASYLFYNNGLLQDSDIESAIESAGIENADADGIEKAEENEWIESAFSPVDCSNIGEREYLPDSYIGKMIDTHIHIPAIPDGPVFGNTDKSDQPLMGVNVKIADYVCMMDSEGTDKVFAFFPVWDPIRQESLDVVNMTMQEYSSRFVPFIMPPESDNSRDGYPTVDANVLREMLAVYPGLFEGYGEIGLYERKGGAAALFPDSARMNEIYPVVRENKLLVYVHLGVGQKESFEKVLEENPDINFIWHGDQLVEYQDGKQDLSDVDDILQKHKNVYYGVDELYGDDFLLRPEVSKEEFLAHFENLEPLLQEDLETWKDFIVRNQDQILWGTDRGWSSAWSIDAETAIVLNTYSRAFIGALPEEVQEKYAYKNAEKLIS